MPLHPRFKTQVGGIMSTAPIDGFERLELLAADQEVANDSSW